MVRFRSREKSLSGTLSWTRLAWSLPQHPLIKHERVFVVRSVWGFAATVGVVNVVGKRADDPLDDPSDRAARRSVCRAVGGAVGGWRAGTPDGALSARSGDQRGRCLAAESASDPEA